MRKVVYTNKRKGLSCLKGKVIFVFRKKKKSGCLVEGKVCLLQYRREFVLYLSSSVKDSLSCLVQRISHFHHTYHT